jgi:hypothetical protein
MEEVCCPRLNVEKWNNKELIWTNKKFIVGKVKTFMFIPLNFGGTITKLMKLVEKSNVKLDDNLCLSDHTTKWNMDILLAVDKNVEGANNITLNGKFYSKVYEGNFKDTNIWCDDFKNEMDKKGYKIKKWYMWYTTCPKCAKKYGKNYTVIIAEI